MRSRRRHEADACHRRHGTRLIVPGSQSGLSSVFGALAGTGRPLLIESPTYWGAVLAAAHTGVTLVPVPTGPAGDPAPTPSSVPSTPPAPAPSTRNPTSPIPPGPSGRPRPAGPSSTSSRDRGAFLVEDDWAHDLGIDADSRPLVGHDDDGHVVYVRSLTKSVSPALRVAAVIARGPARERILADRAAETMYVSGLLQAAALDVVTQPGWSTHLRSMRHQLRNRRDLLLESLRTQAPDLYVPDTPSGGLNLWVRLPDDVDPHHYTRECETLGLAIAPGDEWFPAEPAAPFVRLNFAGEDPDRFAEAGRILGEALPAVRSVAG